MRPWHNLRRCAAVALAAGSCGSGALAPPAMAFNPIKATCKVAGKFVPAVGRACTVLSVGSTIFSAIKGIGSGKLDRALTTVLGSRSSPQSAAAAATSGLGFAQIGLWVLGGATFALHELAKVLSHTTAPQLESSWFSSTYWRVAGIGAVLTLPFLFAAAIQALVRSDVPLLMKAALGYLPLAMLAVAIAAPLVTLLLSTSDELSNAVSAAAGHASAHLLRITGITVGALTVLTHSPFLVFFIGLLTVATAVSLWIELLLREAAVYVVTLMLPLAFAALVWPARRIWAVRAVETLVALILAKFAIVAVLSLGGAAISEGHSVSGMLAGVVLLGMGVFAPWAMLRLIPLAEVASSVAGPLRHEGRAPATVVAGKWSAAGQAEEGWAALTAAMRRDSELPTSVDPGEPHMAHAGRAEPAGGGEYPPPHAEPPVPDPQPPDLEGDSMAFAGANANHNGPGGMGYSPAPETADGAGHEPPAWSPPDPSTVVLLGPEGARPPRPRSKPDAAAPGAPEAQPPSSAEDDDPTPPPQNPEDGRL